nr:type II toxin-antitoxin system PemK/MazF family toxin [Fimbriiglobus sp.]
MVVPQPGQVVAVRFPFSDLSASKFRPAIVLADAGKGDYILCAITSNAYADPHSVVLQASDFAAGGLRLQSYARPGKLFTAAISLFGRIEGQLSADALKQVLDAVVEIV